MGIVYNPSEGLTPKEYYVEINAEGGIPQYRGVEPYNWFKDNRCLVIGETALRVTLDSWVDWCYVVANDYKLEGLDLPAYSGKPGVHEPEVILEEERVEWEIHEIGVTRQELKALHDKYEYMINFDFTLTEETE